MPQNTLVVEIDDASLRTLSRAGHRVILARAVGNSRPTVAWLACEPRGRTTVVWDDAYGLYAAHYVLAEGEPLCAVDVVHPAVDGAIYPFDGRWFGAPLAAPNVPRGHFDVRNDAKVGEAFGLLQSATIDGVVLTSPLNAIVLPQGFTADFSAMSAVYVWTAAAAAAGTVVSNVPVDEATVRFDAGDSAKTCRYDGHSSTFRPDGSTST